MFCVVVLCQTEVSTSVFPKRQITKRKTFMLPQAKPGTRTEVLEPDAFGAFLSPLKAQHFESQPKPASFEFVLSPPIKPLSFPPIKRFQVPKMFQELLTPLNNMLGDNWLKPKDASFDTSFGSGLAHTLTSAADATDDFMDAFGKSMPMHFELAFPSMAQHTTQKSNGGGLSLSAVPSHALRHCWSWLLYPMDRLAPQFASPVAACTLQPTNQADIIRPITDLNRFVIKAHMLR